MIEALRYGKGLQADELTAVHFVLDSAHAARLQQRGSISSTTAQLRMIDCPDRHLNRAAQDLVLQVMDEHADTKVTVLLPRRDIRTCWAGCCTTARQTRSPGSSAGSRAQVRKSWHTT